MFVTYLWIYFVFFFLSLQRCKSNYLLFDFVLYYSISCELDME